MAETLRVDYLVVGAGAMGMAFVDTMLTDTQAKIAIVDRYDRPGGHWTIAYPYVRLHQPSAFYGVDSRHLGQDSLDKVGWNKGLMELASRDEICSYYDSVMRQTFLPSGRVQYFPRHEYLGEGRFRSQLTGKSMDVGKETIIVDATFMKVKVPAMGPPAYKVASDVTLVTPNNLPNLSRPYQNYTVVGAGKTGIDACLWLLAQGVDPSKLTWIMPRDSYFMVRDRHQPGSQFAESRRASGKALTGSIMEASSAQDVLDRLAAMGQFVRLDDNISPTMFRCATVSLEEFEQLKKINSIIRKGRILSITPDDVTLEKGQHIPINDTAYIDCSADGLARLAPVPVFRGKTITLQPVRYCQPVFSAALIAHVEASYDHEHPKNDLCKPVPYPYEVLDYLTVTLLSHRNALKWTAQPKTLAWLRRTRLDWNAGFATTEPKDPNEQTAFHAAMARRVQAICAKIEALLDDLPREDAARARAQL